MMKEDNDDQILSNDLKMAKLFYDHQSDIIILFLLPSATIYALSPFVQYSLCSVKSDLAGDRKLLEALL